MRSFQERRRGLAAWASVAVVGIVIVVAGSGGRAEAAFPGANGKIVFGSQHAGEDEIWVMNADGTNKHNLTRHDGSKISDIDPAWSPDGRQIAFSSDPGGNRQWEIWVMNADGSNAHQLTDAERGRRPSWAADGKSIVFVSTSDNNSEIYRVRISDGQLTQLTNDPGFDWSPAASPSGNKIAFSSDRDGGKDHLYVLDRDTTLTQITYGTGYDDYLPNWSPDGNDIVFNREDSSGSDLYVVHADGSDERQLTTTPELEYFPAFSPDGTKVVYSSCTYVPGELKPDFRCAIHTINLDGTGDTSLGFPPLPFPIQDKFSNNKRNVDLWSILHDGSGGTLAWTNKEMQMSIAADASPVPNTSSVGAHVGANCLMNGDYNAQVDYRLIDWPAGNNVNVSLQAYPNQGATDRSTQTVLWGTGIYDSYGGFIPPASFESIPTTDVSGSLRLARVGQVTTSYYKSGGSAWIELASGTQAPTPALILLSFKSYNNFGHQKATVAFDNFTLTGTNYDCSDIRPNFHPDWAPLTKK